MMPGTRLLAFARLWFAPAIVSSVFEPLVADWQREYDDAISSRRRLLNLRCRLAFAATAVIMAPRVAMAIPSPTVRLQLLLQVSIFWLMTSAAVMFPFLPPELYAAHLWLLVPTFLISMLPFTLVPAIDIIRRNQMPPDVMRQTVLKMIVVATLGMAIGLGWIMPWTNQRWRNEVVSQQAGRPTVAGRGVRELYARELISGDTATYRPMRGGERAREINSRLSYTALPLLLAWIRWRSPAQSHTRWNPALASGVAGMAIAAAYLALRMTEPTWEAALPSPSLGPWISLAAFVTALRWLSRRRAATLTTGPA